MICLTVGPLSAQIGVGHLMSTTFGIVIGTGEVLGGGIAPAIAGYVAKNYGIQHIMDLAAIALVVGSVVALLPKETAPVKTKAPIGDAARAGAA